MSGNALRRQASNNLRGVGQLQSNLSGIASQENTQSSRISAAFAESMANQMRSLGATQLEVDKMDRMGQRESFLSNQADRDNFFTELNKDIGNLGTGVQKTGADLNTAQLNQDFLSLLPELSSYGIGIKRKAGGGYELYKKD
jgi:hypothetical protein